MAYDVFISFKNSDVNGQPTKDSAIAQKLFDYLTGKGLRVFFSNEVLERLGKAQYTRVIDEALDSTKIMIAVGCSYDNLNSQWVRYEWESFINDIRSGIKSDAEVFVLYNGVRASELPRALRQQQAFDEGDAASYEKLYNFVRNALGMEAAPVSAPVPVLAPKMPEALGVREEKPAITPAVNADIPADADVFIPHGTITVKTEDGTILKGVANSVVFGSKTSLYINDEVTLPVKDFKSIEGDPMGMGEARIFDLKGNIYEIEFESYHTISFLSAEEPFSKKDISCIQIESAIFDWEATPETNIKYMLIEQKYELPCVVPVEFTRFAHFTWDDPLRGMKSFSGQPSQYSTSMPIFLEEIKIPSNEIDIPADEIASIMFKYLGTAEPVAGWFKVNVYKKNGDVIKANTRTWSSIHYLTNDDMVEHISTNVKRIVYFD